MTISWPFHSSFPLVCVCLDPPFCLAMPILYPSFRNARLIAEHQAQNVSASIWPARSVTLMLGPVLLLHSAALKPAWQLHLCFADAERVERNGEMLHLKRPLACSCSIQASRACSSPQGLMTLPSRCDSIDGSGDSTSKQQTDAGPQSSSSHSQYNP